MIYEDSQSPIHPPKELNTIQSYLQPQQKKAVFTFSGFLARIGASHQLNIQEAGENSRLPSKKGEIISYLLGALGPDLNKILITNLFKVKYPYSV